MHPVFGPANTLCKIGRCLFALVLRLCHLHDTFYPPFCRRSCQVVATALQASVYAPLNWNFFLFFSVFFFRGSIVGPSDWNPPPQIMLSVVAIFHCLHRRGGHKRARLVPISGPVAGQFTLPRISSWAQPAISSVRYSSIFICFPPSMQVPGCTFALHYFGVYIRGRLHLAILVFFYHIVVLLV